MSKPDDFVHLHTHSDFSPLDGCGKVDDFIETAMERGHRAIAFTEHGNMRGIHSLAKHTQDKDIKPIYGIEFYVSPDMKARGLPDDEKDALLGDMKRNSREAKKLIRETEEMRGIRDRWHLTVWAETDEGLRNLYKLSSMAWLDGFYYKPRIDLETLMEHGDGLHVATGCLSSPINQRVVAGRTKRAMMEAERLFERFGERLWWEVQPHNIDEQRTANEFILKLRERFGTPNLLATQDAHYIGRGDHAPHDVLLCIGTGTVMSDPERFRFDGDEFHFRTRAEMVEAFERNHPAFKGHHIKEALDNTIRLADSCTAQIELDRFKCILPPVDLPEKFHGDEWGYIKELCKLGWDWREIPDRARRHAKREHMDPNEALKVYRQRLLKELRVFRERKVVPYFLIVDDLYKWARSKAIAHGPGRGSSAGSLVSFLLGITSVDPIEHDLLFERFLSPGRIDMPDIDMDFEDVRRGEILDYLRERYGQENVAQITTVGELKAKQCVKDVARVFEVPYVESNEATSEIDNDAGVEDSFANSRLLKQFDKRFPHVREFASALEGMNKNVGVHAAGIVTSPIPLTDIVPLEWRKPKHDKTAERVIVTALDMKGVQDRGLLKLDVLGLRTMTVLRMTAEAVAEHRGHKVEFNPLRHDEVEVDLDDPKLMEGFTKHDFVGVFQFDSVSADNVTKDAVFKSFADVAAFNALNRPGTTRSGMAEEYVKRMHNPKRISRTPYHEYTKHITKPTLGVLLFQEQVIQTLVDVGGFTPGDADELRRKIGKSEGDEALLPAKDKFITGARRLHEGMDHKTAERLFTDITYFGSYGFNKSHSVAYGVIAAWCMWLKLNYPREFYWALMVCQPNLDNIQHIAADAQKHGVKVLPPSVQTSEGRFTIDIEADAIRGSLLDIKGVGEKAVAAIREFRPFKDGVDFLMRVPKQACNRRTIEALVKAGTMDDLLPSVRWFLERLDDVWKQRTKKGFHDWAVEAFKEAEGESDFDHHERVLLAAEVNPLAIEGHPFDMYEGFVAEQLAIKPMDLDDPDFYGRGHGWVVGTIADVKTYKVGDYHKDKELSDKEKKRKRFGKPYANITLETGSGRRRVRVDWESYDDMRDTFTGQEGSPVAAFVRLDEKYESAKVRVLVNIEAIRVKIRDGKPLNHWEALTRGQHPTDSYEWKTKAGRRGAQHDIEKVAKRARFKTTALVTHVRTQGDKNGNEMAWFGLLGYRGYIEVTCFGSTWPDYAGAVKAGSLLTVELENGRAGLVLDGGTIRRRNFGDARSAGV
jgi:DNA polymerase-3 subunit alpha